MKRLGVFSLVGVMAILLAWVVVPGSAGANPGIEVVPSEHDFGEVELNSSVSTTITVSNTWFYTITIHDIYMAAGSSPDFTYALPAGFNGQILAWESIEIQVTYSPSAGGYVEAVVVIEWFNGGVGTNQVMFSGTGIEDGQPVSVQEILDFFDQSVGDGSLTGSGLGQSADGRLNALRNMLEAAGDLIEAGDYEAACEQLWDAYDRCDGDFPPPDFVEGEAATELKEMIWALIGDLGCV